MLRNLLLAVVTGIFALSSTVVPLYAADGETTDGSQEPSGIHRPVTSLELQELEREISRGTRSNIEVISDYRNRTGDLNNQLNYWRGGARLNYKWGPSTFLYIQGLETFYLTRDRVLDEQGTNLTAGIRRSLSDAVEVQFEGGATRFSTGATSVNGLGSVQYKTPGGSTIYVRGSRTNVEESLLSAAGIRPVTGPFAGQLVGQVMDNRGVAGATYRLSSRFDLFGEGGLGARTGRNVESNFLREATGGAGFNVLANPIDSPFSMLRASYAFDYFGFDKDLFGFGGASLLDRFGRPVPLTNLGSDRISPVVAPGNAGVGGYFSPSWFVSNVGRVEMQGRPRPNIEYRVSGFAGAQDYAGSTSRVADGFWGSVTIRLSDHFSIPVTYLRDNVGPFVQQSFLVRLTINL